VTTGLAALIAGELPLEGWIGLVRTTVPPPARFRRVGADGPARDGWWARARRRWLQWRAVRRAARQAELPEG
jgi:glycerol-3-phosphate dehydrogenase (NAD(P)+)